MQAADGMTARRDGLPIERVLDAPRDLVWQAWTDPAHLAQWWAPSGTTARRSCIDANGDRMVIYSDSQEQGEAGMTGVLYELDPPHRLLCGDYVTYACGRSVLLMTRLTSVTFEDLAMAGRS